MLRQAAQGLLGRGLLQRSFRATAVACQETSSSKSAEEFVSKFIEVAPSTLSPPSFPTEFVEGAPAAEPQAALPDKLTLNFYLPHEIPVSASKVGLACKLHGQL
jgi:F-type H+-transporting ATPase subunit delta